jgi:hypothetical protein
MHISQVLPSKLDMGAWLFHGFPKTVNRLSAKPTAKPLLHSQITI